MDPTTVVITLAINLTCSGGLYYLIARNLTRHSGLGLWAAAGMTFGISYLARLFEGLWSASWVSLLFDVGMIGSAMLFVGGMRQFVGRPAGGRAKFGLGLALYAALLVPVFAAWGLQGRFALLNGVLGLVWCALALTAAQARRQATEHALRAPLAVTAGLIGVLGLMTLMRCVAIMAVGVSAMSRTIQSQIYYGYASLAVVLLALNLLWMVFVRLHGQLAELASRDSLTRLLNRNGLDDALKRHFAARQAVPVTLLQIDVDHFKHINDRHGHATGDAVLRAIAQALTVQLRASDIVARVGGEEFVVVCIGADAVIAGRLAERLRNAVGALALVGAASEVRCTVSVGVSRPFARLSEWEAAWHEADAALYSAKSAGRNRVIAFEAATAAVAVAAVEIAVAA